MVLVVWESIKQLVMELAGTFTGSLPIFRCPHQQLLKVLFSCHCIALFGTFRAAQQQRITAYRPVEIQKEQGISGIKQLLGQGTKYPFDHP